MANRAPVPRYFPVLAGPLEMRAGLFRFGTDFGNPLADGNFLVRDEEEEKYRQEKARVLARAPERIGLSAGEGARGANRAVLEWLRAQLGPAAPARAATVEEDCRALSLALAEDFVVLTRDEERQARVSLFSVCFPSGWAPERILGWDFAQLHAPIPAFDAVARSARALTDALLERGPYVRFVWTLSPDADLDHHPSRERQSWSVARTGFLRVERQLTVPFPEQQAGLFLIRTFCYAFTTLSATERQRLADVLRQSSDAVLRYKGLLDERAAVLELLRTGER